MGFLMKLFGQKGTVRFEGTTNNGQTFTGKTQIEVFACDKEDIIENLKQMMYVEKNVRVKTLNVTGFCEN
jgi:hypothetical protein